MNAQMEVTVPKSAPKEIIARLRAEAAHNPAFNAVCHVFAMRERTRQQITLMSLQASMAKEGFNYNKTDYTNILKYLAGLGIGILDTDNKGQIRALKGIKVTLQSIGLSAISKKDSLEKWVPAPEFVSLVPKTKQPNEEASKVTLPPKNVTKDARYNAALTVEVEGKPVTFKLPSITLHDLSMIFSKLYFKPE